MPVNHKTSVGSGYGYILHTIICKDRHLIVIQIPVIFLFFNCSFIDHFYFISWIKQDTTLPKLVAEKQKLNTLKTYLVISRTSAEIFPNMS